MRVIKSAVLIEYPASLSYQPITFTNLPSALVRSLSKIFECGFPTISVDTSGSVEYSNIPLKELSEAALKAAFTSSTVVSLLTSQTRSGNEPVGVGTRTAPPSNFALQ